jgi:hypothetical protein
MPFQRLSDEQERLLWKLLELRASREMLSDSFNVIDVSTMGGSEVIVSSGGKGPRLADCTPTDFMPLAEAGYITFQHIQEPDSFGGGRATWHGAILQTAREYKKWRKSSVFSRWLSALAPQPDDLRRVLYSGAFAAVLVKLWDDVVMPLAKSLLNIR